MTTRRQLESAIARLAVSLDIAEDWIDSLTRDVQTVGDANKSLLEEHDVLLAENTQIRAELETVRKLSELYQAQSVEFCAKYEDEEKRAIANFKRAMDCDMLRKEAEDDLRTIGELRAEVKRLMKVKVKR